MPTLDQLRVLDAIDRLGTFAAAAEALHRVPSAVSYSIRMLEEDVGIRLFERIGNRNKLTAGGRALLTSARRVLDEASGLDRVAATLRDGWEPELQIVVDGLVPLEPIAEALATLTEGAVPTRVRVDVEYQEGVPARWQADGAALMVLLDFDPEDDPLVVHPLKPLEMVLVAAPGHPALSQEAKEEVLQRHIELVVKDSAPSYREQPKAAFHDSQHVLYLSDFHSKRLVARTGVGFGWLPMHLIRDDLEDGSLVELPRSLSRWTYRPSLVHRSDRPLGRAGQRFREALLARHGVQES